MGDVDQKLESGDESLHNRLLKGDKSFFSVTRDVIQTKGERNLISFHLFQIQI